MQPIRASCAGVIPLIEACVATGIKIGRETRPWGRVRIDARAFVVYNSDMCMISTNNDERGIQATDDPVQDMTLTEHLAITSKESAADRDEVGVCSMTELLRSLDYLT